jgi:hypothetical protein
MNEAVAVPKRAQAPGDALSLAGQHQSGMRDGRSVPTAYIHSVRHSLGTPAPWLRFGQHFSQGAVHKTICTSLDIASASLVCRRWWLHRPSDQGCCGRLRKAVAAWFAEQGRSTHEIVAVTGHRTSNELHRYTKLVEQKKLATRAPGAPPPQKPRHRSVSAGRSSPRAPGW